MHMKSVIRFRRIFMRIRYDISLIALENGITTPEDSTREWSGKVFWNEDWNKDINFSEAFRTSYVWYYRQVIDNIRDKSYQKRIRSRPLLILGKYSIALNQKE